MIRIIQLALLCSLFGVSAACAASAQRATGPEAGEPAPPLQDDALRVLLSDVSVTPGAHGGLDDGPSETFRANGIYQRLAGRGSAPGEPFEIRNNAVCVPNGGPTPRCRRVRPNGDGTWTFIDTIDGSSMVMTVTPLGTANDGPGAFLGSAALRILLNDVSVTDTRTARGDDGPAEIFRANGIYQRIGGRGVSNEARYEISDGAVCARGDGASRCRRVRANGNGTWTFINTADGSSAVMTVTPLRGAGRNRTSEPAAPLQDGEIRALLVDATVAADRGGDDGPFELFLANGVYQRGSGWGMTFEGRFEIRGGAVCVRGGDSAPLCRRVLANGDGTYTFTNTADGTSAVMTVTPLRGAAGKRAGESAAPLQDDALRALFFDVYVPAYPGLYDSPAEFFRANGTYQRDSGRGAVVFQGRFEIRDGAVCVWGEGLAPLCRRVLANGDGTYTFTNTADGASAVMTIIALQGARRNMTSERAAPLQDDALRALLVGTSVSLGRRFYDAPAEIFRANGAYQRDGGRGAIVFDGRFEIRDGAVCVQGEGLPPLCRRVLANGDGTYTFINTADGTSAIMTVIPLR